MRWLVSGIGYVVKKVDGCPMYEAKDLRVGLFGEESHPAKS